MTHSIFTCFVTGLINVSGWMHTRIDKWNWNVNFKYPIMELESISNSQPYSCYSNVLIFLILQFNQIEVIFSHKNVIIVTHRHRQTDRQTDRWMLFAQLCHFYCKDVIIWPSPNLTLPIPLTLAHNKDISNNVIFALKLHNFANDT